MMVLILEYKVHDYQSTQINFGLLGVILKLPIGKMFSFVYQ